MIANVGQALAETSTDPSKQTGSSNTLGVHSAPGATETPVVRGGALGDSSEACKEVSAFEGGNGGGKVVGSLVD